MSRVSNASFVAALALYFFATAGYFGYVIWKSNRWKIFATVALGLGWIFELVALVGRVTVSGHAPWGNMYEFTMAVTFVMVGVFLFVGQARFGLAQIGGYVAATAAILMSVGWVLYAEPGQLQPALRSNWLTFHVMLVMVGASLLLFGAILESLYLVKVRWERVHGLESESADSADGLVPEYQPGDLAGDLPSDLAGDQPGDLADAANHESGSTARRGDGAVAAEGPSGLIARLPSAERLDSAAYRIIMFAFPIWTLGVIAGAIWGEQAWGRYWGWDPKETWSFIVWVIFAAYLHARATRGWKGRGAAILAVIGGTAILINFYAVNLWIAGLHSYAGI